MQQTYASLCLYDKNNLSYTLECLGLCNNILSYTLKGYNLDKNNIHNPKIRWS